MGGFIVKLLIFIINVVLWACGIVLIVFGSIALASPSTIINLLNLISGVSLVTNIIATGGFFEGMSIFMIVLGCFLFLFGGVGCCGAFRMHKRMIMNYWIMLILGVLTEIGAIIYGCVYPGTQTNTINTEMQASLNSSFVPVTIGVNGAIIYDFANKETASWEELQVQTQCCGVVGPDDYKKNGINVQPIVLSSQTYNFIKVPPSCCISNVGIGKNVTNVANFTDLAGCQNGTSGYWTYGCNNNVNNMIWNFDLIAIIISSCLMVTQILGIILTVHHWHKMVREDGHI